MAGGNKDKDKEKSIDLELFETDFSSEDTDPLLDEDFSDVDNFELEVLKGKI